jgi:hypothetical protein
VGQREQDLALRFALKFKILVAFREKASFTTTISKAVLGSEITISFYVLTAALHHAVLTIAKSKQKHKF